MPITSTLVAMLLLISLGSRSLDAADDKRDRLAEHDTNEDGKLSRSELGEQFWNRAAGFDADGDELLDKQELAALFAKRQRGVKEQVRPGGANAAFSVQEFRASNGQTLRYSVFVPTGRDDQRIPLVLCLHGAGGNTAAANLLAAPKFQQQHPCVVMAPACNGKATRWVTHPFRGGDDVRAVMPELIEAIDHVVAEHQVDSSRLYITGQSLGGVGTWGLIANHPTKFAAAVPVCGMWAPADAKTMNGVAIWAFHGADDKTVPVSGSRDMIAALKDADIKPGPRYTEFPGVGHGSWERAYSTAELWEWLFQQHRVVP